MCVCVRAHAHACFTVTSVRLLPSVFVLEHYRLAYTANEPQRDLLITGLGCPLLLFFYHCQVLPGK